MFVKKFDGKYKYKYFINISFNSNSLCVLSNSKFNIDDENFHMCCDGDVLLAFALYLYPIDNCWTLEINKNILLNTINIRNFFNYEFGTHFGMSFSEGDIIFSTHKIIFGIKDKNKNLIGTLEFPYELL